MSALLFHDIGKLLLSYIMKSASRNDAHGYVMYLIAAQYAPGAEQKLCRACFTRLIGAEE